VPPVNKTMKKNICAACGQEVVGGIVLGGTILCRTCEPDISAEIERLRAENRPVNVAHIARKKYREETDMSSYLLRDFPADLLSAVKQRALNDTCSQRDVILSALRHYLE
jgi:hypothetical protein